MAKAARRDGGVGAIADDLLLDEVFARVADPVDLFRCAGVCRRWLRLIADPAFLRRAGILPEDARGTSFVAGVFYQNSLLFSSDKEQTWKFKRLYAWPAGADGPWRFFVPNPDVLFNWAKPLASRRGLLLVRVLPTPLNWQKLHLVVCDPLTGRHRAVPPLTLVSDRELCGRDVTGYAILTDADDQDRQQRSTFKVLCTTSTQFLGQQPRLVYAYSYSSAKDGWSAPIKCSQVSGLTMSGPRAGVVARGIVYWLYRDEKDFYALGVSADATEVSLTRIPTTQVDHDRLRLQPPYPCIAGGKLSVAIVDRRKNGVLDLDLWTKHDEDRNPDDQGVPAQWTHSNMMSKEAGGIKIFAFAEGRGALLIQDGHSLFTLDLENKKMEPVTCSTWYEKQMGDKCNGYFSCGCRLCIYNRYILYEMDWPSYILNLYRGDTWSWR